MTTVTNASIASFFPMGVTSKPNFLLCRRRTAERVVTTDSWFSSSWWARRRHRLGPGAYTARPSDVADSRVGAPPRAQFVASSRVITTSTATNSSATLRCWSSSLRRSERSSTTWRRHGLPTASSWWSSANSAAAWPRTDRGGPTMERPARSSWPDHASGRGCTGPTRAHRSGRRRPQDRGGLPPRLCYCPGGLARPAIEASPGRRLRVAAAISLTAARIVPSFKSSLPQSGTTVGPPFVGLRHFLCEPLPVRGTSRHPRLDSFLVTSRYLMARR